MIAILLGLIAGSIVLFSVQNTAAVAVSFLVWKFETSFAFIIFFAVLLGVLAAQLLHIGKAKREARDRKNVEFINRKYR